MQVLKPEILSEIQYDFSSEEELCQAIHNLFPKNEKRTDDGMLTANIRALVQKHLQIWTCFKAGHTILEGVFTSLQRSNVVREKNMKLPLSISYMEGEDSTVTIYCAAYKKLLPVKLGSAYARTKVIHALETIAEGNITVLYSEDEKRYFGSMKLAKAIDTSELEGDEPLAWRISTMALASLRYRLIGIKCNPCLGFIRTPREVYCVTFNVVMLIFTAALWLAPQYEAAVGQIISVNNPHRRSHLVEWFIGERTEKPWSDGFIKDVCRHCNVFNNFYKRFIDPVVLADKAKLCFIKELPEEFEPSVITQYLDEAQRNCERHYKTRYEAIYYLTKVLQSDTLLDLMESCLPVDIVLDQKTPRGIFSQLPLGLQLIWLSVARFPIAASNMSPELEEFIFKWSMGIWEVVPPMPSPAVTPQIIVNAAKAANCRNNKDLTELLFTAWDVPIFRTGSSTLSISVCDPAQPLAAASRGRRVQEDKISGFDDSPAGEWFGLNSPYDRSGEE